MSTYYVERRGVLASEAIIGRRELAELRRLAAGGAAYESAAKGMRDRHAEMLYADPSEYRSGWLAAIREFSERVVAAEGNDQ